MKRARVLRLLPPLALGVGVAAWLISQSEPPGRVDETERSVVARTLMAETAPVRMIVRGYGNVRAARSWEAVSEIAGTIVWRHPDLDTGNVIAAGTKVLQIDPTAYELAVAQAEADLAALEADVAQLEVDKANTDRLLSLEQNRLDLAETELARIRDLVERGIAAQSALDSQERATLQVQRGVEELRNALGLFPSRRIRLDAQKARIQAVLERARRDLDKTDIIVPFDLRIAAVHVERHQFVGTGQKLVTADDIGRAEITAQIPLQSFLRLMGEAGARDAASPAHALEHFDKVDVEVRLVTDISQTWTGKLVRVESALDPQTRSVPAIVIVENPYAGATPPVRLPLVPNMYVELVLTGPELSREVTLPASAIHEGRHVYLRGEDGRLALRDVSVAWWQADRAVIDGGIAPGEEVILDDLMPAIPGMAVIPAGAAE